MWKKPNPLRSLLVLKNANVVVSDVSDQDVTDPTGRYHVAAGYVLNLTKDVKAGRVILHVEGDPEPVTTREPVGINAKWHDKVAGGVLTDVAGVMFNDKPRLDRRLLLRRILLVTGGLAVVAAWYWLNAHGGLSVLGHWF